MDCLAARLRSSAYWTLRRNAESAHGGKPRLWSDMVRTVARRAGHGPAAADPYAHYMEISTASGQAQAEIDVAPGSPAAPTLLLVLTHGAGGGVASKDLIAASRGGLAAGAVTARVLQPYRVRGASAPGSPDRQDAAWLEIIAALRSDYPDVPLVQGGRSNGARVACRTARPAGAAAVLALAFPLHPPGRAGELRSAGVPVLVINGERDPFGIPDEADVDTLIVLPGQAHALSGQGEAITAATSSWLRDVVISAGQRR